MHASATARHKNAGPGQACTPRTGRSRKHAQARRTSSEDNGQPDMVLARPAGQRGVGAGWSSSTQRSNRHKRPCTLPCAAAHFIHWRLLVFLVWPSAPQGNPLRAPCHHQFATYSDQLHSHTALERNPCMAPRFQPRSHAAPSCHRLLSLRSPSIHPTHQQTTSNSHHPADLPPNPSPLISAHRPRAPSP